LPQESAFFAQNQRFPPRAKKYFKNLKKSYQHFARLFRQEYEGRITPAALPTNKVG